MAQARAERFGSIFYRALGLIRSGALKYNDRPVWFDVYAAHPPLLEPIWNRRPMIPAERPLREIYYEEDKYRALYHNTFAASSQSAKELSVGKLMSGSGGQAVDLADVTTTSHSQRFVNAYMKLCHENPDMNEVDILDKVVNQLKDEGITLFTHQQLESLYQQQQSAPPLQKLGINIKELTEEKKTES